MSSFTRPRTLLNRLSVDASHPADPITSSTYTRSVKTGTQAMNTFNLNNFTRVATYHFTQPTRLYISTELTRVPQPDEMPQPAVEDTTDSGLMTDISFGTESSVEIISQQNPADVITSKRSSHPRKSLRLKSTRPKVQPKPPPPPASSKSGGRFRNTPTRVLGQIGQKPYSKTEMNKIFGKLINY